LCWICGFRGRSSRTPLTFQQSRYELHGSRPRRAGAV
jgi:hypothetical protein